MSGDSTKIEIHAFDYGEYEINVENQDEIDALYEDLKIKHKIA
jgi:hypothetical protein